MLECVLLLLGGLIAGTLGGLLGLGGGIILMPLLRFGVSLSPAFAAGTCVLAVFFTTLGGSYRHVKLGNIHARSIVPIIVSGIVASAVFSVVFKVVAAQGQWIDLGIGAVFLLIALRMIVESIRDVGKQRVRLDGMALNNQVQGNLLAKATIGAAAGALPGLLGIGTGGILVPAMTFCLHTPVKIAMAASLCCFCFTSLVSAIFKMSQGYVSYSVAIPICIGTLVGANFGAILNKRFSSKTVKLLFGLVFLYVALKFVLLSF